MPTPPLILSHSCVILGTRGALQHWTSLALSHGGERWASKPFESQFVNKGTPQVNFTKGTETF